MNFQVKGFYSEQDQDMRISGTGDVDMRSLPPVSTKVEPSKVLGQTESASKMDVDIRNQANVILPSDIPNVFTTDINDSKNEKMETESNLTIDEKQGA